MKWRCRLSSYILTFSRDDVECILTFITRRSMSVAPSKILFLLKLYLLTLSTLPIKKKKKKNT